MRMNEHEHALLGSCLAPDEASGTLVALRRNAAGEASMSVAVKPQLTDRQEAGIREILNRMPGVADRPVSYIELAAELVGDQGRALMLIGVAKQLGAVVIFPDPTQAWSQPFFDHDTMGQYPAITLADSEGGRIAVALMAAMAQPLDRAIAP